MFTGIIQAVAPIVAIEKKSSLQIHVIDFPAALLPGLHIGASVACNGCCLTVTAITGTCVSFDIIRPTLQITTLGEQYVGTWVNLERAITLGSEVGGHFMSGHISCTAEIVRIVSDETQRQLWFLLPEYLHKYLFPKGFIGIDGVSLTIDRVQKKLFCVNLIPETLRRSTLGKRRLKERVNIELDNQTVALVDTLERLTEQNKKLEYPIDKISHS